MEGLTQNQVIESRQKYGSNKLPEPELKKWYHFAKQALSEKITIILIIIAIIQLILAFLGVMEFSEPIMIMLVLGIVTAIAVKTGLGVQKSSEELRKKSSIKYCDVIRDSSVQTINKNDIVVGDIVCISTGQEIFADGYIIEGKVAVNNAAINGESKECEKTPVEGYVHTKYNAPKSTDAYTNRNYLFAGTSIMSGEGKMIVTEVGVNTVNGDTLLKTQTLEAPKTALELALDRLSDFISKWGTIAAIITFIVLLFSQITSFTVNTTPLNIIKNIAAIASVSLSIIVAAVPEGLPLIVKFVTKQNVGVMEKYNILAKNPSKIPELAYVNLICTDKTGTLTTGIMSPQICINGLGKEIDRQSQLFKVLENNIVLNNSAVFDVNGDITGGNSIDRAILTLTSVQKATEILNNNTQKAKQVFSSTLKYSAYSSNSGSTYYKGAPEKILSLCTQIMDNDGNYLEFDEGIEKTLKTKIKEYTSNSMRCIALAINNEPLVENKLPNNLVLIGIIGVVDPIRTEVPNAVTTAHNAGIQVIEMTGDSLDTAIAIAKEAGIYKIGDVALTDNQFSKLTDDEVKEIIPKLRVIARCSPNTKLRLITLAQEIGMSVAMTGDGVNDAPSLKRADVGFGMQCGSDVTKDAADIVLTDNNFASVVRAVKLGRTFMHNIIMFLEFQLPINISLLILSMIYPMIRGEALLASVQILLINIIMDSLNSLSFGGEPPKDIYMTEKPIIKGSGLFSKSLIKKIALSTISFIGIYALLLFTQIRYYFDGKLLTARFALLCFMAIFNGFNIRTQSINIFEGIGKNKAFICISTSILLSIIILCTFAENLLNVTTLSFIQWSVIIGLAILVIPIDTLRKYINRKG